MTDESLEEKIIKSIYQGVKSLYPKSKCNIEKCENNNFSCCNNDAYLLTNDVHEQSLSGALYYYLNKSLSNKKIISRTNKRSLDMEYNKTFIIENDKINPKRISCNSNCFLKNKICDGKKYFRPDIILHQRGNNNENILIIECKKANDIEDNDVQYDFEKLKAFTCENGNFKYKIGVSIVFNNKHPILTYFINKTKLSINLTNRIIDLLKTQNNDSFKIKIYKNEIEQINTSILNYICDINEIEHISED